MKILLFGGSGQLGYDVIKRARDLNFDIVSPVRDEIDISREDSVLSLVERVQPEVIFNSAAYTNVDGCVSDYATAHRANAIGPMNLALACRQVGIPLGLQGKTTFTNPPGFGVLTFA